MVDVRYHFHSRCLFQWTHPDSNILRSAALTHILGGKYIEDHQGSRSITQWYGGAHLILNWGVSLGQNFVIYAQNVIIVGLDFRSLAVGESKWDAKPY